MSTIKKITLSVSAVFVLWAAGFFVFVLHSLIQKPYAVEQTTDAIVVLTGGKNRIEEGLKLFAEGRATHLFITGVHEDVTKQELTSRWSGESALPPCCITLGYEARSTSQNAQETKNWLKDTHYHSIRLVTGNYHMNRSLMEFRHALHDVDVYPHPVKQSDLTLSTELLWHLLFSEYHKTLYRRVILLFTF